MVIETIYDIPVPTRLTGWEPKNQSRRNFAAYGEYGKPVIVVYHNRKVRYSGASKAARAIGVDVSTVLVWKKTKRQDPTPEILRVI